MRAQSFFGALFRAQTQRGCEGLRRRSVPQGFVQREFGDRHSRGAGKARAVKAEVQEEPLYLLGREVQTMLFKEGKNVLAGQGEDEPEAKRRALSLYEGEAVGPEIPPEGVGLPRWLLEEILLQVAVHGEFSKGRDLALDEGELVEGF